MNRRAFNRMLLLGMAAIAMPMTGCDIVADLIDYIPWIVRALNSIQSILGSFMPPPAGAILSIILGALADLQASLVQYQADSIPADKASLLAKIKTFLRDIGSNFQLFLDNLGPLGTIPTVIIGIIQVVLSTLGWFSGNLPQSAVVAAMPMPMTLRATNQILYVTPQKRSLKQFKSDFNSVVILGGHSEQVMY
jgi:hypothetical protein